MSSGEILSKAFQFSCGGSFGITNFGDSCRRIKHQRRRKTTRISAISAAQNILIYDNVFDSDTCEELHYLALEHSERCKRGSIFDRSSSDDENNIKTPLEQALNSYLSAIGDDQPIVEYWTRNEFLNMEAHADLDEDVLEATGHCIRCPTYGHVLYLGIQSHLRGPTCVFANKLGGWTSSNNDKESGKEGIVSMVSVPAVQGRVLRFPGSAVHAVPKPANRWIVDAIDSGTADTGRDAYLDHEEEDEFDSEYDFEEIERSVVLFNTWPKGPKGVPFDKAIFQNTKDQLPEGIALDDDDDDDNDDNDDNLNNSRRGDSEDEYAQRVVAEWEEDYGPDCEELHCQAMEDWIPMDIVSKASQQRNADSAINAKLRIPLMGNQRRRLHPTKHAELTSFLDKEIICCALQEDSTPNSFEFIEER